MSKAVSDTYHFIGFPMSDFAVLTPTYKTMILHHLEAEGIEQGEIQTKREVILKLLDLNIGNIPDTVSKKVSRIRSRSRLDSLLEQVATAQTLDDIKWN